MRLVASVLMLLLLQTAPSKPKPVEYKETRLPNGLTVITHEDHSIPVINAQIWYHVGSKDEKPGKTGFAHLFEHLMFKGSAHIKPTTSKRFCGWKPIAWPRWMSRKKISNPNAKS